MATFSKRANASQLRMLRIVEGAVKNFMDAHPDWRGISEDRIARSIAKRAVGTLSSQLDDVLALASPSVKQEVETARKLTSV